MMESSLLVGLRDHGLITYPHAFVCTPQTQTHTVGHFQQNEACTPRNLFGKETAIIMSVHKLKLSVAQKIKKLSGRHSVSGASSSVHVLLTHRRTCREVVL